MSKFSLNQHQDAERRRKAKEEGKRQRSLNRHKKPADDTEGIKSDSVKSLNDSNANYDSSPQLTEQKSVRQMILHTHEKDRGDDSDDQIVDFVDEEGRRYDPTGE